jgi:hypothetical protein
MNGCVGQRLAGSRSQKDCIDILAKISKAMSGGTKARGGAVEIGSAPGGAVERSHPPW